MKKYESIFLSGCAYAITIVALFFGFAAISNFTEARMGTGQFFIILLFGQIISAVGFVLKNSTWHVALRYSLHYLTLLVAFTVIFIFNGKIKANGGAAIFSATLIFTFLYVVTFLVVYAVKKSATSIEKKSQKKDIGKKSNKTSSDNSYSPRFK